MTRPRRRSHLPRETGGWGYDSRRPPFQYLTGTQTIDPSQLRRPMGLMAALVRPKRRESSPMGADRTPRDPRGLRHADSSWDFRGQDTKYATHGIFRYPAMMVAPVVRRLIDEY